MKKITFEGEFEKITIEFENVDVSIDQIFDKITGALVAFTYQKESIDNWICERADEIREAEDDNGHVCAC